MTFNTTQGNPPETPSLEEVLSIHNLPLTELLFRAQTVHRQHHPHNQVQLCTLLSVKTGGCPEDCGYCSQSSKHESPLKAEKMLTVRDVIQKAEIAKANGSTRFCMGTAWREVKDGDAFENVLDMVRGVRGLGLEACATLGMLTKKQSEQLRDAGLTAYNHNLDTSREHYEKVISTRTYDDRLQTLNHVMDAGISVCSGGILGLGESVEDRCAMLIELASLRPQPGSVPINALVPMEGTPMENHTPVGALELVRMCATARIMMPNTMVRLSAGRHLMNREAQLLCFMAGANSIFFGEQLLTSENTMPDDDVALIKEAGLTPMGPYVSSDPVVQMSKSRLPEMASKKKNLPVHTETTP